MVLQLEPLHTCNLTCTGCGRIREYSTSLKDMVPLEQCLRRRGLRRPHGLHLRRGAVDLSQDRGTGRRVARPGPHHLHLHQRRVHAEEDARVPGAVTPESPATEPAPAPTAGERTHHRKGSRTIRKARAPAARSSSPSQVDVLERPCGRPRIHPRPHRRARGRVQGMRRRHQDGQDPRLPGRHQHHGLQGNRRAGTGGDVQVPPPSAWMATPFPRATITTPPRRTWSSAWAASRGFLPHARDDHQKFAKDIEEWGRMFTIFGTPVYQEFLAGKRELTCTAWAIPTYNVKGWKGALLPDDRRPLPAPTGDAREGGLGEIRRRQRRRPRSALRELHGALRLRPSGALGTNYQRGDNWKNFKYNFWPRPPLVAP
jgi:hypothetical protein